MWLFETFIAGAAAFGIIAFILLALGVRMTKTEEVGRMAEDYESEFESELEEELHSLNELCGVVESVVYQNEKNGYAVFRLIVDGADHPVTVVGNLPFIGVGEELRVEGSWTRHASYGEQFKATSAERTLPASEVAIVQYLSSGNLPGIGPISAKRLVEKFGRETFDILENHPELVAEIPGLTKPKAIKISETFKRQLGIRRLMEQLISYSIRPEVALRLYRIYGEFAGDCLRTNPYILVSDDLGVDFALADSMALDLGFGEEDAARVDAGVIYELDFNTQNGHVFIPADKLAAATAQLLSVSEELTNAAIERLCDSKTLLREDIAGVDAVYLRRLYEAECETASRLRLMAMNPPEKPRDLDRIIDEIGSKQVLEYAPLQSEAIRVAASTRVMLLTGGPGTGKSTTVRGMLEVFDRMGLDTRLASPTGRAAKRLSELTGRDAVTVHRLLEVDFGEDADAGFSFVHGADDPLTADVVILDECSMVDLPLFAALIEALKPDARLILVGDPDQLPSVGPGSVLADLLQSGTVETVRLVDIFRQAQSSNIILAAHSVNRGELPELRHKDGDLYFIQRGEATDVADTVVDLCIRRLAKMGFEPERIQVLSPTRRGPAGTASLNRLLQAAINPPSERKAERKNGEFVFREGDRVMHIKNNYDLQWRSTTTSETGMGVFNGDIGRIDEINNRAETLAVRYDDRYVVYPFELLDQLELAYAMTVHKSQGSEYPAVVLVASDASPRLLTRQVFYTALTRAQSLLVIVGSRQTVAQMVTTNRRTRRYSGLKYRLSEQ